MVAVAGPAVRRKCTNALRQVGLLTHLPSLSDNPTWEVSMLEQKATMACGRQEEITGGGGLWILPEIFFQPTAAFQKINRNPAWLVPLLAAALFRLARTF